MSNQIVFFFLIIPKTSSTTSGDMLFLWIFFFKFCFQHVFF